MDTAGAPLADMDIAPPGSKTSPPVRAATMEGWKRGDARSAVQRSEHCHCDGELSEIRTREGGPWVRAPKGGRTGSGLGNRARRSRDNPLSKF